MFEFTNEQYAFLHMNGNAYCKLLAVAESDIEDMLSAAFVQILTSNERFPDRTWEDVSKIWKSCVKEAVIKEYHRTKFTQLSGLARDYAAELMEVSEEGKVEWTDFQDKVINKAYEILNDDDILTLVAFVDCNLNVADTAKYLNVQRTNLYHMLKKIRTKVQQHFPEHKERENTGRKQKYGVKTQDWHYCQQYVEVVPYIGWMPAFFDTTEAEKVWPVTRLV